VNTLDYVVLFCLLLGIAAYGTWRTRGPRDLRGYLKGDGQTRWFVIGLSVMATQASATTFLSIPGQGYMDGLGFVQNYFGAPFALIIIAAVFLPLYRKLNVYTAYEFLGRRFDGKTRLLGAALFLLQRGIGAGLTIYAPAIVLSSVFGWRLDATIICSGLVVVIYTVSGGSEAVTLTQKYQLGVIFAGMTAAFFILLAKLPSGLAFSDTLALAGGFHKLQAVNFSTNVHERYTVWSGLFGGMFLALSYFGTDQSQVQRYISGASLRESRLGLMFNAACKIPMQFFILLLGVLIFVFYQFEQPPVLFNQVAWQSLTQHVPAEKIQSLETRFTAAHTEEKHQLELWLAARKSGDMSGAAAAFAAAGTAHAADESVRQEVTQALQTAAPQTSANENDYVFITFILHYLPHGIIGLLVAAFFAAALSSKAGELNALGSATTVDFYRHVFKADGTDAHYVAASRWFTAFWGVTAILVALFANLSENLIQAANILGSVFYGAPLGLFLIAFFLKWISGSAAFWSTLAAQALVLALYFLLPKDYISYLWYNLIGAVVCVLLATVFQAMIGPRGPEAAPTATP